MYNLYIVFVSYTSVCNIHSVLIVPSCTHNIVITRAGTVSFLPFFVCIADLAHMVLQFLCCSSSYSNTRYSNANDHTIDHAPLFKAVDTTSAHVYLDAAIHIKF